MNIENIIKNNILQFAKENNININNEDLNLFMKNKHEKRTLSLNIDNYISVCEYLYASEILILTTLCKEYMNYHYKNIWNILQKRHFPNSTIPINSYLDIRNNIAIESWFSINRKFNCGFICKYDDINDIEIKIKKLSKELSTSHKRNINYTCKTITNMNEMKYLKREREAYLNDISIYHKNAIDDYRFLSEKDYTGDYYYALKPELDMRLFGLDPDNEIDKKNWIECMCWITGEYTKNKDYDFEPDEIELEDPNQDVYTYYVDDDNCLYRIRIAPECIDFLFM